MDRFIGNRLYKIPHHCGYLKSNMDRFIDTQVVFSVVGAFYLKSNMDRFIVFNQIVESLKLLFKIQYG